ncbi:MAG: ascorbate transporter subunit [Firmicutes bacterium]|nr:ascorbate transporter subunit [Bacillota bacterium]
MTLRKILCCCISGFGSSFIMEMNVKKALDKLGLQNVEVDHCGVVDVVPGSADLFICASDTADECSKIGDVISLNFLTSVQEVEDKLRDYLEKHGCR